MKKTKLALFQSVVSLLLCISMLAGTTFAWFTDSVTSANNIIKSGKLDVEMFWADGTQDPETVTWTDASTGAIFDYSLWEPGYTQVRHIKIENKGNLALKYQLHIQANGDVSKLSDVIDVYFLDPAEQVTDRSGLTEDKKVGTLTQVLAGMPGNASGSLKADEIDTVTIALKMQETAGNEYQNLSIGSDFSVILLATQEQFESDSFGTDYDENATFNFPANSFSDSVSVDVTADTENKVAAEVNLQGSQTSANIPTGVQLDEGTDKLTLAVNSMSSSKANITLGDNEAMRSLDVHVEGISADNTVPMKIYIREAAAKGLNAGNLKLYHVENGQTVQMHEAGATPAHNQFKYDPATGDVTLYMATFSEVAMVADTENAWEGKFDYTWYDSSKTELTIANADQLAAFGAIVGGMKKVNDRNEDGTYTYSEEVIQNSFEDKTVMLLADVNLGDNEENNKESIIFYPIGYYNSDGTYERTDKAITSGLRNFEGIFDGQGHTIANFYQNTWEMKGDNNYYDAALQYYRDGMGLFGKVYGGTVKNLTVDNFKSDGEYTTTGVIAAYADGATFENIAITKCNPRVYNIGNGGIVGCVGWYAKEADLKTTFKNITVDNSNKISALWGSYDVACGGIVGQYYPTSGQSSANNPVNAGIHFENCHVAAQMDVYNDVCGNYQYYAYRYAGMIIGSIRENLPADENGHVYPDMTGITAQNCTVNYGNWNDYYYCEYVKNGHPSYSGPDDYKFSRVPNSEIDTSNGKENATCIGHNHTDVEDNRAIYLPFDQLFTGYGWGVTSRGVKDFEGIDTINVDYGDQEKSDVKFESKFTGDFLYRVGNANAVSLGSLFAAKDGMKISNSGVVASVEKVDENSNVSGTFTANTTDWTKGTIKFESTGVVKVTIQDYNFCTPTEMLLEVVDAVNATSATSATKNNVVLLNDITNASFTVSNGYTFYGNGFTIKLPTNSVQEKGQGFTGYVSIGAAQDSGAATGGNLDNVRIEGPVYTEMYLYRSQAEISDKNDPDYGNGSNMRYFRNSVIVYGGNCTISNSYISGCRTPVCLRGGNNVVIDNTTLSGGSVANMQVAGVNSLVLRDLTTEGTLGIYVDSSAANVTVEGELKQYNWTTKSKWEKAIGGSANAKFFPDFFSASNSKYAKYQHQRDGETYVNMAFVFACDWDSANKWNNDRQTNKNIYSITDKIEITTPNASVSGGVYTIAGQTLTDELYSAPAYKASGYNPVAPSLTFDNTPNSDSDDANDANDTYCVYNEASGTLRIGVSGDSKTIDLSKVTVSKNGANLDYTAYLNGSQINGDSVTIKAADGAKQTLTFKATSKDAGYDKNGNPITGSIEYTWTVTVEIAVLSYPAPVWNMGGDYQFDKNNCLYAYYGTSNGYGEAVAIYEGIKVNYYNKSGTLVNLDLSGTTTHPTGSNNSNSNAFTYTLSDGATLTMKFSSGWKSGATTHQFTTYQNKVFIYPQSLDNDNYIRAKVTNQDFDVKISYTFTDPNGQSVSQTMQWYNAMASNSSVTTVQWKDFDSVNGKKASVCVTPDTLVTLADGTQKRIDQVNYTDRLLAWDFFKGELTAVSPAIIFDHGIDNNTVIELKFSDGTTVKAVNLHQFFDADLNQFVTIDADSVADYVGHKFAKKSGNGYKMVTLVDYSVSQQLVEAWGIISSEHYNIFVEGMFSTDFMREDYDLFNYFEVGSNMTFDAKKMQSDIEKYGLYTYADFAEYLTFEQFKAFNVPYFKIAVGKGNYTYEGILALIEQYLSN